MWGSCEQQWSQLAWPIGAKGNMENQTGIINCNDFNPVVEFNPNPKIAFKVPHNRSSYNFMSQLEILIIHRNEVHQKYLHWEGFWLQTLQNVLKLNGAHYGLVY